MIDIYLMALIKKSENFNNEKKVYKFFQLWPSYYKYYKEIFGYIFQSKT